MKNIDKKSLTLKTLNKSNVWDVQENDIFRMLEAAEKDADMKENLKHYIDIIKSAFDMEEIKTDRPEVAKKYEARGFKTGTMRSPDGQETHIAIKKRPIMRVTDLTYENIRHITAEKPHGSDKPQLRRRMGLAVAEHTGHHTKRIRHKHHHPAQRPTAQARRYVREEGGRRLRRARDTQRGMDRGHLRR